MAEAPTLTEIINTLFKTIKRTDGQPYTPEQVATWCTDWLQHERGGGTFSREYVRQLKLGIKDNPTKSHLEALAAFFDVDPAIFLDTDRAAEIRGELDLAVAIRDAGVSAVAMRAVSLTPDERAKVLDYIKLLQTGKHGSPEPRRHA